MSAIQCYVRLIALAFAIASAACGSDNEKQATLRQALQTADSIELFSVTDSKALLEFATKEEVTKRGENLAGMVTLGSIKLTDPAQRSKIVEAFADAAGCFGGGCMRPACFTPRHVIRAVHKGSTSDYIICFECKQVKVKGAAVPDFMISGNPEATFDGLLKGAGIALARELEKRANTPSPLNAAVHSGDVKQVRALLAQGVRPDEAQRGGMPMRHAAWNGHHEIVRAFLDAGAKVEGADDGRTPLQEAAYGGHLEAVRILLERGANVHALNSGDAALHLATHRGNPAVVALLLEKGADPNMPNDYHGRTPLHIAASKGNVEVVKMMLARGADPGKKSKLGKTPLEEAREDKQISVVKLLESGSARNAPR